MRIFAKRTCVVLPLDLADLPKTEHASWSFLRVSAAHLLLRTQPSVALLTSSRRFSTYCLFFSCSIVQRNNNPAMLSALSRPDKLSSTGPKHGPFIAFASPSDSSEIGAMRPLETFSLGIK